MVLAPPGQARMQVTGPGRRLRCAPPWSEAEVGKTPRACCMTAGRPTASTSSTTSGSGPTPTGQRETG